MQTRTLQTLIFAVVTFAVAVVAAAGFAWDSEDLLFLSLLAGLTVFSEVMDFGAFKNSRISVSIALMFAAGVFIGLPGAVAIAGIIAAADAVAHPKAMRKVVFNVGTLILTAGTFVGVLEAFTPVYNDGDYIATIGPVMAAGAIAFAVNSGLVSTAISLDNRLSPAHVWSENFRWMLPHYVFMGILAVLIALSYDRWEIGGFALAIVPLAMLWIVMKQYADNTVRTEKLASGTPA